MIKTIRTQLLVINTAVLIVIFAVMSVYLVGKNSNSLRQRLKNEAQSFATLATAPIGDAYTLYGESGTARVRETIKTYLDTNDSVVNAAVVDLQGKQLFAYAPGDNFRPTPAQASTFTPIFDIENQNLNHVIYPYFGASGARTYSVVYTVSNEQINRAVRDQTVSLVVFTVLSLLITSVVTYAAINRFILNPIRQVSEQAAAISSGDLNQQIKVTGNNEIARLGRAVNAMADSLKADIAKLQEIDKVKSEFMAITSHNLRTPLTIMSGYLENMHVLSTVDELKQAMQRIGESVKRLANFAEDVLTISRFELGQENATRENVAIGDFMQKIASEALATAELKDLRFKSDIQTNAAVSISPPHIRSAVWNIIDNAIKFTDKGGQIELKVYEQDKSAKIAVTDTGIGISQEEIPKLFTKFHRATSVTKYDYEGTGIGLYASRIIVEEEGGTIDVTSQAGKGSTFTINLPLANA